MYSRRPRAEVEGVAVLVDRRHSLRAVLRFGAVKGGSGVLRRSDGITGELYDTQGSQVRRGEERRSCIRIDSNRCPICMHLNVHHIASYLWDGVCGHCFGAPRPRGLMWTGAAPHRIQDASGTPNTKSFETEAPAPEPGSPSSGDDEDFESASETDWELRQINEDDDHLCPPLGECPPSPPNLLLGGGAGVTPSGSSPPDSYPPSPRQSDHSGGPATSSSKQQQQQGGSGGSVLSRMGFSGMLGFNNNGGGSSQASLNRGDDASGVVISRIEGSWLSHLDFDGKR